MSIIKFQSRDGEDDKAEWMLNLTDDVSIRPEKSKQFFPTLLVVDDVYDTGKTFRAIKVGEKGTSLNKIELKNQLLLSKMNLINLNINLK